MNSNSICRQFFIFLSLATLSSASKFSFATSLRSAQRFAAGFAVASALAPNIDAANAFGPVEMTLSNINYKQVELCGGKKPIMPGQKAMEGSWKF